MVTQITWFSCRYLSFILGKGNALGAECNCIRWQLSFCPGKEQTITFLLERILKGSQSQGSVFGFVAFL